MPGQINRGDFFGEEIYKYASNPNYTTYVEVGTWNGQGSTKCFMDAIFLRPDESCLYTLEANTGFHSEASAYWQPFLMSSRSPTPKLHMLYGRIIETNELLPISHIQEHKIFNQHPWLEWRERNVSEYEMCDNVINKLPEKIDVLLLDGGQFSTQSEWEKLKDRTKIILLDDTSTFKTEKIREEILDQRDVWDIIYDDVKMRNGILIASRKGE